MDICTFAIWKFRNIEGFLRGFRAFDVRTSKYLDPATLSVATVRYDYVAEKATIEKPGVATITVGFSGLVDKLKELGMYAELPKDKRHGLAGPQ